MHVVLGAFVAVLLIVPRISLAQSTNQLGERRAFVDVSMVGSANSDAKERDFTSRFVTFGEIGSSRATYPKPSKSNLFPMLDVSAGYMTARSIALGAGITRISHEDTVGLRASIPHPAILNAPGVGTGVTSSPVTRTETGIHAFFAAVPFRNARVAFRIFGGPSYYWYKADMVSNVLYTQSASPTTSENTVTIEGFSSQQAKGRGLGLHIGSDFTYFINQLIGVKAGLRYGQANVTIEREPLSRLDQEVRVGGTQIFLGVRFRFGE